MSRTVVRILLCLLWLQLAWLETQREDQMISSLILKGVLLLFMALVVKQIMQIMRSTVDRFTKNERVHVFIRRIVISCIAISTVRSLLQFTDVISRPIYLPQLANIYIPNPISFSLEEDETLVVPGFILLNNEDETNRLYQHYISNPHNDVNTIQAGIIKIGKGNFCVTNPITFSESDNFTCYGPRCLQYLQNCMTNPNKTFTIIPLTHSDPILHAVIIVNHVLKEIELYDANGILVENTPQYQRMLLAITNMGKLQDYDFLGQMSFGYGILQQLRNGKYKGLESLYTYWYLETRFLNPDLTPQILDEKMIMFVQRNPDAILQYLKPRISLITGVPIQFDYRVMSETNSVDVARMSKISIFQPSMFHDYKRKQQVILQQLVQQPEHNVAIDKALILLARKELEKVEVEIAQINKEESWVIPILDTVNHVYNEIKRIHIRQSPILIEWVTDLFDSWDLQGFKTLEENENFPSWPLLFSWDNLEQYWQKEKGLAVVDFFNLPLHMQVHQARWYLQQKLALIQEREDNGSIPLLQIAPRTTILPNTDLKMQLDRGVERLEKFTKQYKIMISLIQNEIDYFEKHGKSTKAFQILKEEKLRELRDTIEAFKNQT